MAFVPSYMRLARSGSLRPRARVLEAMLGSCTLCPHHCRTDRLRDEHGRCHTGARAIVSSYTAHFGEEPPLVGDRGIGNIFFGNCTLRCAYCQNYQISQRHRTEGERGVNDDELAAIMLELQHRGCHAIGLVSPTHVVPQILRALERAVDGGLRLPLVYNTSGYEELSVLRLLEGIVDIYLPDLKYADETTALRYSGARDYVRCSREAILEMHRQVGPALVVGEDGLVKRGLIIRHLVLPNDLAGSRESLAWIHREMGQEVTVSLMAQYYPANRTIGMPLLDRPLRASEYDRVIEAASVLGLERGWAQELDAEAEYRPDFTDRQRPFDSGAHSRAEEEKGVRHVA